MGTFQAVQVLSRCSAWMGKHTCWNIR